MLDRARPLAVYYAGTREDAARAGFDDAFVYEEIARKGIFRSIPFIHIPLDGSNRAFEEWRKRGGKQWY